MTTDFAIPESESFSFPGGEPFAFQQEGGISTDLQSPPLVIVEPDPFAVVGSPLAGPEGPPGPAGPAGPPGQSGIVREALVDLNAYTVVKVMTNNKVRPASSLILSDGESTTGVTTAAALAGELVPIRTVGAIDVNSALPIGPLYLGTDGALTADHDTGEFQLRVGYAQTPNLLIVRIDPPIYSV